MKKSRLEKFKIWAEKFQSNKGHGRLIKTQMYQYADLLTEHYNLNPWKCKICKCTKFHDGTPMDCHLDHIDGDSSNNSFSNLQFICPNCHHQQPTSYNRGKWEFGLHGQTVDKMLHMISKKYNLPIGDYHYNDRGEKCIDKRYAAALKWYRKEIREAKKECKAIGIEFTLDVI